MITYRYPELLFILLMPFVGKHRDMLRYRHLYPYISKKSFIWAGEHVMLEQYDEHRLGNSVAVAARIIYRLSKLVPDNMDRSGLFSFFSKELRASFHYDRFSIFLYDAERDFLTAFTAADGTVVVFSDTRIAQNTVAWQAIQTRKPVVIKNLASLNWGGAVSLASVGLTATIALPLILNRQVIGTLHVSFVRQPDNLVEILNLLQQLSPVLTTFLFVILTEERRARTQAADRAALDSPCETEAAFPLENSLLETKAMTKVMALARKAAKLHIPVLISGETGTGKSMLARWLHLHSPRRAANFVKVNCPSLAPTLFESEMFGYAKGAVSRWPRKVPCFLMKSVNSHWICKASCSRSWRRVRSRGWAMPALSMLISACFPPPILIWKRRWRRVGYDGTCSTVWPRSRYAFLHCAIGKAIYPYWWTITLNNFPSRG